MPRTLCSNLGAMGSDSTWTTSGLVEWLLGDEQTDWLMGSPTDEEERKDSEKECWWAKAGLFPSATACRSAHATVARRRRDSGAQLPDDVEANELRKQLASLPRKMPLAVRLYYESGGAFHPVDLARRRVTWSTGAFSSYDEAQNLEMKDRVSVPVTFSEQDSSDEELERLWKVFRSCKWTSKEFVIVELYSTEPNEAIRKMEEEEALVIVVRLRASWRVPPHILDKIGILMSSGDLIAASSASTISSSACLGLEGAKVLDLQPRRELLLPGRP